MILFWEIIPNVHSSLNMVYNMAKYETNKMEYPRYKLCCSQTEIFSGSYFHVVAYTLATLKNFECKSCMTSVTVK